VVARRSSIRGLWILRTQKVDWSIRRLRHTFAVRIGHLFFDVPMRTKPWIAMHASPPQLNLVVLRSPDIDRAAAFYQRMGLLFTRHAHGSGPQHYSSEVSGFVFEIYPTTAKSGPTTGTRIGFRVDSVDEVVRLLTELGTEVVTAPHDSEWGRRAVVKDLDGHVVELLATQWGNSPESFLNTASHSLFLLS
jgi:catechol 2,3-dioxygenase-like lactoylglutathione lyase family enzyme